MRDLIREELRKFSKQTLLEQSDVYYACQRFKDNKLQYALCKKISSAGAWLYDNKGLGMKNLINQTLEPLYNEFTEDEKKKFAKGARILRKIGKIDDFTFNRFIEKFVNQNRIVKVNGQWHPVNKLNTNHRDLSEFLTDLIFKNGNKDLIMNVIRNPKESLMGIKDQLQGLISKHFQNTENIFDYTKNITYTSRVGEEAEESAKKKLEELGLILVYQGGDGDVIDMIFGTDLIMGRPDIGYKTIQVKRNEGSWDRTKEYRYVDWVVVNDPFTIYDNKTKQPVEL
jgi:hypothetical protein